VTSDPPRSGILNVDKPAGLTSHDVVQAIRRAAGVRRVGHAGTLDPMATGVLVVCIGSATRVVDDIQDGDKCYRATVRLGVTTTTQDAEGDVVTTVDPTGVSRSDVEAVLATLRGETHQVPPMYSARHHEGERLYRLARRGVEVDRPARPIWVHALDLADWAPPDLVLEMRVGKGTYVRTLAHDLGQLLGVGAHLAALQRTAVGRFILADADALARVVDAFADGSWPGVLHPLDTALLDRPAIVVDPAREAAIRQGQQVDGSPPADGHTEARVYDATGHFVGLVRWDPVHGRWQPDRVFPRP
jgi:tRNA pseudouridine55 synthase